MAKSLWKQGGQVATHAARAHGVPKSTMCRYFGKLRRGESLEDRPRSGRPPKNTSTLRRRLANIKRLHPYENAAFYARELTRRTGEKVGVTTVRAALHQLGYDWRLPSRKKLTEAQRAARVAFAREHLEDSWDTTWAFDEAYFQLYRSKNRYWVRASTEEDTNYDKLTSAQEKISLGIAVAISRGRKSALAFLPRSWTADTLVEVFDRTIYPSLRWSNRLGHQSRLILDNDGRHHQTAWTDYMDQNQLRPIRPWPANSPDLSPVENVFAWMKREVEKEGPSTLQELEAAVTRAWEAYPLAFTVRLMDSMPGRLQELLRRGGRRLSQ